MERKFKKFLIKWRDHALRTPLIVRGARQVGKTYTIQEFGKTEFKDLITINFEIDPHYCSCFQNLDPISITNEIEYLTQKKIVAGETLLFLDEIQECPQALQALRYFKEKIPELHVIAAGSLLEFAIKDENFSFPVGRIQFARMHPLSFEEYLIAKGDSKLIDLLASCTTSIPPSVTIHQHLLKRIKEYFKIGGMPAAVFSFLTMDSYLETSYVQKNLLTAFESDFGKYAKKTQHKHLKKVFSQVPFLLGDHVKYSRINPDLPNPAREIKHAIELLRLAGLVQPIHATSAGALPLISGIKETIFKLLFLDIGLVGQAIDYNLDYPGAISGAMTEQFVGQELLATSDPVLEMPLFFWMRDKGSAEVDYLFSHHGKIYPIEVKAGKTGKLKSLYLFMKEKEAPFGVKISMEQLSFEKNVLSIPLYMISHLTRLIDSIAF